MKHTALIGHQWNLWHSSIIEAKQETKEVLKKCKRFQKSTNSNWVCGESGGETHMQDRQRLENARFRFNVAMISNIFLLISKLTCIKACIWSVTAGMMALALSMISRTKEDTACSSLMLKKKRSDNWKMRNQLVEGSPNTSSYNSVPYSQSKQNLLFTTAANKWTDGLVVRRLVVTCSLNSTSQVRILFPSYFSVNYLFLLTSHCTT